MKKKNLFHGRQMGFVVKLSRLNHWLRATGLPPPEYRLFSPRQEGDEVEAKIDKAYDKAMRIKDEQKYQNEQGRSHSHGWKPYYRLDDESPWAAIALRNWEDSE